MYLAVRCEDLCSRLGTGLSLIDVYRSLQMWYGTYGWSVGFEIFLPPCFQIQTPDNVSHVLESSNAFATSLTQQRCCHD
jgi:hypothetical protein